MMVAVHDGCLPCLPRLLRAQRRDLPGCGYLLMVAVFTNSLLAASPGRYLASSVWQQKMRISLEMCIDDGSCSWWLSSLPAPLIAGTKEGSDWMRVAVDCSCFYKFAGRSSSRQILRRLSKTTKNGHRFSIVHWWCKLTSQCRRSDWSGWMRVFVDDCGLF